MYIKFVEKEQIFIKDERNTVNTFYLNFFNILYKVPYFELEEREFQISFFDIELKLTIQVTQRDLEIICNTMPNLSTHLEYEKYSSIHIQSFRAYILTPV